MFWIPKLHMVKHKESMTTVKNVFFFSRVADYKGLGGYRIANIIVHYVPF